MPKQKSNQPKSKSLERVPLMQILFPSFQVLVEGILGDYLTRDSPKTHVYKKSEKFCLFLDKFLKGVLFQAQIRDYLQ
jgi:hypothetical protein